MAPAPELPEWLAQMFPQTRSMLQLDRGVDQGRRMHLVDHGEARDGTVLLVHGNPTWSYLWRKVIAELGEFRCVAPDLLGLGLSERLGKIADHTVDRHADAVAALVEQLDLEDFVLVGQDWGGPISVGVGARLPERIRGVVLANTAVIVPDRPRGTSFHRFARMPLVSDFFFRVLGFPQNALHKAQGEPGSIRGDVARAYRWPLRGFSDRVAPLAMARMVPDGPEHPSMAALQRGEQWVRGFAGPLALVWGLRDPILGRALRRQAEALPRASVRETEAGHFLQEEVPGDLAEAVREVASA